jgi:hypothetical protein
MRALNPSTLAAAIIAATAAVATAQQPVSFDGSFAGYMTEMPTPDRGDNEPPACVYRRPVSMSIQNSAVTISYLDYGGNDIHFRGNVTPGGAVTAWHTNNDGSRSPLTGRFMGNATFVGYMARDNQQCPYVLNMTVQRGPS